MRAGRLILVSLVLGVVTALAMAWALAAWMPLTMYPRQVARHFVAGGRPWSVAERRARGVWNLWWSEINQEDMTPPKPPGQALADALKRFRGQPVAPDPLWPSTADGWVIYAEKNLIDHKPPGLELSRSAPTWGTFAGGAAPEPEAQTGTDHGFGWPRPAMWYRVTGQTANMRAWATAIEGAYLCTPTGTLEVRGYDFRALPLRIAWRGLLIDVAVFSSGWLLLLAGPGAIRRRLRVMRGRCPVCGYDLRATPPDAPCPECGRQRASAPPDEAAA